MLTFQPFTDWHIWWDCLVSSSCFREISHSLYKPFNPIHLWITAKIGPCLAFTTIPNEGVELLQSLVQQFFRLVRVRIVIAYLVYSVKLVHTCLFLQFCDQDLQPVFWTAWLLQPGNPWAWLHLSERENRQIDSHLTHFSIVTKFSLSCCGTCIFNFAPEIVQKVSNKMTSECFTFLAANENTVKSTF